MSRFAKITLVTLGTLVTLIAGLVIAVLLYFDPTLRGLRPNAVFSNLSSYSLSDLTALSEAPPVDAILLRDERYERGGGSGWFVLTGNALNDASLRFSVSGVLQPALGKIFKPAPKRCNGTDAPAKAIIAYEPERQSGGFLGRSFCRRAKADIADLIARADPVSRQMRRGVSHSEFVALQKRSATDPDFFLMPQPLLNHDLAFSRVISLPIIADEQASEMRRKVNAWRAAVELPVGIGLSTSEVRVDNNGQDAAYDDERIVYFRTADGARVLRGVRLRRIEITVHCAFDAVGFCKDLTADFVPQSLVAQHRPAGFGAELLARAVPVEPPGVGWKAEDVLSDVGQIGPLIEKSYTAEWFERR